MPYIKPDRAHYIPKGARRVQHKHSSAVAYVYEHNGQLCAVAFHGRAQKPDWRYRFGPSNPTIAAVRENYVNRHFARWQEIEGSRQRRKAEPHQLKPGDVLRASWGYDQTNIDYYEVIKLIGASMVEIREIEGASANDGGPGGDMTGQCVPLPGAYKGEPMRKRADGDGVKIASYAWARKVEPQIIAGVPVYPSSRWSSYA